MRMRKIITFGKYVFVLLVFGFATIASAQITPVCPAGQICNPLGTTSDISTLLTNIINWLIAIASPIATAMIVYGAFQMLTSGGEPEKFNKGKTTILYTAIGYAIVFIGWGITSIITIALGA